MMKVNLLYLSKKSKAVITFEAFQFSKSSTSLKNTVVINKGIGNVKNAHTVTPISLANLYHTSCLRTQSLSFEY